MKNKKPTQIKKTMTFAEIMQKWPKAGEILMKSGMHCLGCPAAMYETLEQGALMHGLNADKITEELNKKLRKK